MSATPTPTGTPITLVLWDGTAGGTESVTAAIAGRMRALGSDARVLFIGDPRPMSERLDTLGVPWRTMGIRRSRAAFLQGARIAKALEEYGTKAVILPTVDAMARALRGGGYRGRIVAIDHGSMANLESLGSARKRARLLSRSMGVASIDVQVAVSQFMRDEVERYPHASRLVVIYNGVDTQRFHPSGASAVSDGDAPLRVRCACRLIAGKGLPELLDAFDNATAAGAALTLDVAGTGPLAGWLREKAARSGGAVRAVGHVEDMSDFWRGADVCAAVANEWRETFGMTAAEAMACGVPVVATRNGGLMEVVEDGVTGILVPPGDAEAIARALGRYAANRDLLRSHGSDARERAVRLFDLDLCARTYMGLSGGDL